MITVFQKKYVDEDSYCSDYYYHCGQLGEHLDKVETCIMNDINKVLI